MDLSIVHIGPGSFGGEAYPCPIGWDGTSTVLGQHHLQITERSGDRSRECSRPGQGPVSSRGPPRHFFRALLGARAVVRRWLGAHKRLERFLHSQIKVSSSSGTSTWSFMMTGWRIKFDL